MGKVVAWLELGRVSNLPTVWANVMHGLLAAYVYAVEAGQGERPPTDGMDFLRWLDQAFVLLVGMSLVYLGGMMLNDVCDAKVDATERPARPIPSGRVCRHRAAVVAGLLLVLGWATTAVYANPQLPWLAAGLVACVVAYNLTHRVPGLGLVFMPACRVLLVLTAAFALPVTVELWIGEVAFHAAAIGFYTAVIILVAWFEARPGRENWPRVVGYMVAAMSLIDAVFLYQLGMWPAAIFCVACSVLTAVGQRFIPGS